MKYIRTIRLAAPSTEPVTLTEAKDHLRVSGTTEDTFITAAISAARDSVENYCNRYFATATAKVMFDTFPDSDDPLDLYYPDIDSIESIAYTDFNNAAGTVTTYTLDSDRRVVTPTTTWPTDARSVTVSLTMGAPVALEAVKQAILLVLTDIYENRSAQTPYQIYENRAAMMMMQPYRVNIGI